MANEAELRVRLDNPINMQCGTGGIEKGAILVLTDALTASGALATSSGGVFAGICAREKVANDGNPVAVYRRGIFDLTCGAIGVNTGELVMSSGANLICPVQTISDISGGHVIGMALETGSASEKINVLVGVY